MFEAAINIRWLSGKQESKIKLDDRELSNEEIGEALTDRKNNNPTYRVVIRGDRDTPAVEVQKVMALIAQSGIDDISFSALNQDN